MLTVNDSSHRKRDQIVISLNFTDKFDIRSDPHYSLFWPRTAYFDEKRPFLF